MDLSRLPPRKLLKILKNPESFGRAAYRNILTYGLYYHLLKNLFLHFPKEQVFLVKQDELVNDADGKIVASILQFLGIEAAVSKMPKITPQKSTYDYKLLKIRQFARKYKFKYDKDYSKSYTVKYEDLQGMEKLHTYIFTKIGNAYSSFFSTKDIVSKEIKSALYDYYEADIKALHDSGWFSCADWLKK